MPRETIRKLSEDTERLLVAGAHLAAGNADLGRDKDALEKLIAKLGAKSPPVFAKLSEQIDKVLGASPKAQAGELVTLMMSVAQVRAGLAQLAPVAEDTAPLEAVPEIQTPCNAKDLYALHDALVTTGQGRMEKVNEAVERGDVADLRLVHAVVQAMGDGYLGDTVSDKVVPAFGRAVSAPIRSKLKFPGKKVDGRRLRALAAVEKAEAQPLLEQAIREGSAEVRESALDAIADHLPGMPELESLALGVLAKERTGDVRRAAVRALAGYRSDASFETLLAALDDERTVHAASEALGTSQHPKVVDALLERLPTAITESKKRPKSTDKPGVKKQSEAKHRAVAILRALAEREDPRVVKIGHELLDDFGGLAGRCIVRQGKEADLRAVADRLEGDDASLFGVAVTATLKLGEEETFKRFSKVLRSKDRASKLGKLRVAALDDSDFKPSGDAWVELLVKLAKEDDVPAGALKWLGATKDERGYKPLLKIAAEGKAEDSSAAIHALGALGDSRAVDTLVAVFQKNDRRGWAARHALLTLAEESTVDKVRTVYAKLKKPDAYENWMIRHLLHTLERRFPGS